MKTTTTKIATTFTAAIKAGAQGIVTVISAAESSRLRWRHVFGDGVNPGVSVGQRLASLAQRLEMRLAKPAVAAMCRPHGDASGRRPSYRFASRMLASV